MKEEEQDYKRYHLSQFSLYDCDHFITFNIIGIDTVKNQIIVAITNEGKISICTYELRLDKNNCLFFEYGVMYEKIAVDDFEHVEED